MSKFLEVHPMRHLFVLLLSVALLQLSLGQGVKSPLFNDDDDDDGGGAAAAVSSGSFRFETWIEQLNTLLQGGRQLVCPKPSNFPLEISVEDVEFLNWSEELRQPGLWTATPSSPEEIVTLANWAYKNGHRMRARGYMHSWAPITVTSSSKCGQTLLVDTTKHLTKMRLNQQSEPGSGLTTVSVQTGANWEDLLTFLEAHNYGVFAYPAVGKMTVGGTLAVGAHGTGFPVQESRLSKGFKDGSISNLITSLDAVVWDPKVKEYVLKTFKREDEDTRAFLVHLGRAFLTEVTLQVGNNYNLRCQSITNITADTLFGPSAEDPLTLGHFVQKYDRVEAQYFPYTDKTWLKLWTVEETKSSVSQAIHKPYPYTHGNQVFRPLDRLISLLAVGITGVTPIISRMTYELGVSGVGLTRTADVWGPSKNSLLYYHTLSHKFISLGYTVVTTRHRLQDVVHRSYKFYTGLSTQMSSQGKWPMNQPIEFRITGLDKTEGSLRPPSLSFLSQVEGHPEYDVAVFLGLHYFPGTRNGPEYMKEWESFLFSTFNGQPGTLGTARVEWAKTWAFDSDAPWVNSTVIRNILPPTYGAEWNWAINKLNEYDPHRIYTNDFLDHLMAPI